MAVILTPNESEAARQSRFSIYKLISKLRSKRSSGRSKRDGLLEDNRPPLIPSPLPLVLPQHQPTFCQLGWTTITFPQSGPSSKSSSAVPGPHPLQSAYQGLFSAAQKFFDQPDEEKKQWRHRLGSAEGWSKIPGEKEFITLRTLAYTPDILKQPAKRYWDLMGVHLSSTLGRISASLNLSSESDAGLRQFAGPCGTMGENEEDKTSTMLRIFRYECWDAKVVAEAHADLGLLSCVVGDVPGLEVWNGSQFFDIERHYNTPCATMLVGRQLERLSNFRYPAGGHRVVSYRRPSPPPPAPETNGNTGAPSPAEPRYRHSIVFVLRAHEPVAVDSAALETEVTGKWADPISNTTAGEIYEPF